MGTRLVNRGWTSPDSGWAQLGPHCAHTGGLSADIYIVLPHSRGEKRTDACTQKSLDPFEAVWPHFVRSTSTHLGPTSRV